jgi:hypothetical protein
VARHVHERATGVTRIDWCVGLNEIAKATTVRTARPCKAGNNARGHGLAHAKRVANGQHEFTHLDAVAVAQRKVGQVIDALDLQNGQITCGVTQQNARAVFTPVVQHDPDVRGLADNVIVGHDDPVRRQNYAGPKRVLHPWLGLRKSFKKSLEERVIHERRTLARLGDNARIDVHNRRGRFPHKRRKTQGNFRAAFRQPGLRAQGKRGETHKDNQ